MSYLQAASPSLRFRQASVQLLNVIVLAFLCAAAFSCRSASVLAPGHQTHCGMSPGQVDSYRILLKGEEFGQVVVDQRGSDITSVLKDPSGETLMTSNFWPEIGQERLLWISQVPGHYLLELTAGSESQATGCYEISFVEPRKATDSDHRRVAAASLMLSSRDDESEEGLQEALSLWQVLGDSWWQAQTLVALSNHLEYKEPRRSAEFLERMLEISNDKIQKAFARYQLSFYYSDQDKWQEALGQLDAAQIYWATIFGSEQWRAKTLSQLGLMSEYLGDYARATHVYAQALELCEKMDQPKTKATILYNRARIRIFLRQWDEAHKDLVEAIAIRRLHQWPLASALILKSYIDTRDERYDVAIHSLQQVLVPLKDVPLKDVDRAGALIALGHAQQGIGASQDAGASYRKAYSLYEDLRDEFSMAAVNYRIARMHLDNGNTTDALATFEVGLKTFRDLGDLNSQAESLLGMARSFRATGRHQEARATVEESLDIIENLRSRPDDQRLQFLFRSSRQHFFDFYIDLLMEMHAGDPTAGLDEAALAASERSRARSLLETIEESGVELSAGADVLTNIKTLTVSQIQEEVLDKDTSLLEYHLGPDKSYLWHVTVDKVRTFELPPRSTVEDAARSVHELLPSPYGDRLENELAALSGMILDKASSGLTAKRLLIVNDGALQYVPFAALPLPGVDRGKGWPRRLISRYELVHLPSVSVLAALRERGGGRAASKEIITIGNPVTDDPHGQEPATKKTAARDAERWLPELGSAEDEIQAIRRHYPTMTEVTRFEATKERVMKLDLYRYRLIHFVTHGTFEAGFPAKSNLVLSRFDKSGTRIEDWRLYLPEIYQLNLSADLVVLSACQTALGEEIRGEGLVGMAHGFMHAGAARVIASLWNVSDDSTMQLMSLFYEHLASGMPAAAALQGAQLGFLEKFKERQAPLFWAGFILLGDF